MSSYVLDSSALLAVFNREPGRDVVLPLMEYSALSTVNVIEVATKLVDQGLSNTEIVETLASTKCEMLPLDKEQAMLASYLRAQTRHRGLSLGDRACLALASTLGLPVLTADRAWEGLDVGVDVRLIR